MLVHLSRAPYSNAHCTLIYVSWLFKCIHLYSSSNTSHVSIKIIIYMECTLYIMKRFFPLKLGLFKCVLFLQRKTRCIETCSTISRCNWMPFSCAHSQCNGTKYSFWHTRCAYCIHSPCHTHHPYMPMPMYLYTMYMYFCSPTTIYIGSHWRQFLLSSKCDICLRSEYHRSCHILQFIERKT